MKAIKTNLIVSGIRARVDGSLGLSCSTPELTVEEKVAFMELQNKNLVALFEPLDETPTEVHQVKSEINQKTPSQRLRAVMFLLWRQSGNTDDFENFYRNSMEKIIDALKAKLD